MGRREVSRHRPRMLWAFRGFDDPFCPRFIDGLMVWSCGWMVCVVWVAVRGCTGHQLGACTSIRSATASFVVPPILCSNENQCLRWSNKRWWVDAGEERGRAEVVGNVDEHDVRSERAGCGLNYPLFLQYFKDHYLVENSR